LQRRRIADTAQACGLSVSYFARFRRTMGAPPYKWLMNEHVRKARRSRRRDGL